MEETQNTTDEKRVLLGLHEPAVRGFVSDIYKIKGRCIVEEAATVDEMKRYIDNYENCKINAIVMDANLGNLGTEIEPARKVYALAKEKGIKFLAISGNPKTIENALKEGIPAKEEPFSPMCLIELVKD